MPLSQQAIKKPPTVMVGGFLITLNHLAVLAPSDFFYFLSGAG